MKKVFAIIVAVALMLMLLPGSLLVSAAEDVTSIVKSFAEETYGLCDNVTGTIVVNTTGTGVVVEDVFPEELTLGGATVDPSDGVTVDIDEETNTLTVTLGDADDYTITFWAQVTYACSDEEVEVTNTATAYDSGWDYDNRMYGEGDDATLTIEPYEGFVKELADGENDYQVTRTPSSFDMVVNIENTLDIDMCDVEVKDNLPGNIIYEDWDIDQGDDEDRGTVENTKDNDGKKNPIAHLVWDLGDDEDGCVFYGADMIVSTLTVSTDSVGGKNKDKHDLKKAGSYTLNPGATLMFIAGDTGFACTVQSAAVRVNVVPAAPEATI